MLFRSTAAITGYGSIAGVVFHAAVRPSFRIRMVNLADTLQRDTTGATLKDTLVVQVYDPATGNGVQGISVTWTTQAPTGTDGFAVNSVDTTDNTGLAKNRWVLRSSADGSAIPSSVVAKRMVANATGIGQVEFKARAYPGAMRSVTGSMTTAASLTVGTGVNWCATDRKSTRLNSSHTDISRMPSSA